LTPHNRKEQQNMNAYKITYILDGEEHYYVTGGML